MTRNRNRKEKERKLKNNKFVYIVEAFILTAAAVFLSAISSRMLINPAGLICAAAASALFACVIFLMNSRIILPVGMINFAIIYVAYRDVLTASASLTYIVVGAFIYFGVKNGRKTVRPQRVGDMAIMKLVKAEEADKAGKIEAGQIKRTRITIAAACFLSVFYAGIFIAHVISLPGAFSIGAVSSVIDGWLESASEIYYNFLSQSQETANAAQLINESDAVKELVSNFKAILISLFIVYNLITAYLSTALFRIAYNIFIPLANPGRKKINNRYWRINMSLISAIIMITSIFLSMILSDLDNRLPWIVMTNLIYILVPGFFLMGIYFIHDKMFKSGAGIFALVPALVGTAVLLFFFPFAIIILTAFFLIIGIYAALIGDIRKFYEKVKSFMSDDDDDDDYMD